MIACYASENAGDEITDEFHDQLKEAIKTYPGMKHLSSML